MFIFHRYCFFYFYRLLMITLLYDRNLKHLLDRGKWRQEQVHEVPIFMSLFTPSSRMTRDDVFKPKKVRAFFAVLNFLKI